MSVVRSACAGAVVTPALVLASALAPGPAAAAAAQSEVHLRGGAEPASSQVTTVAYGVYGDLHLLCDWNGDGRATLGVYRATDATWYVRQSPGGGPADLTFRYGRPGEGDRVLCGDWDGDGDDSPGLFRASDSTWHLRDSTTAGAADRSFRYGRPGVGDTPLVGDWDDDGDDSPGIFRSSDNLWYLRNAVAAGGADTSFRYGRPGSADTPLVGDWDGDGADTPGLFRASDRTLHLRNRSAAGPADWSYALGLSTDRPLAGDWDADGRDEPAVSRQTPPPPGTACRATAVRFSHDDSAQCLLTAVAAGDRTTALNYGARPVVDALSARRADLAGWQYDGCFPNELVTSSSGVSCGWFDPLTPGAVEGVLVEAGMSGAFQAESLVTE